MASDVELCNRALAEIGTRSTISSLTEQSNEAQNCALIYDPMRRATLRAAHWSFAREQVSLSLLGQSSDGSSPFPFLYKYAYPSQGLALRYLIPPAPDGGTWTVPLAPDRNCRFLIMNEKFEGVRRKIIVSNLASAIAVLTGDVTETNIFDSLYEDALVCALAAKLVIPLSGNIGMKQTYMAQAERVLQTAQAADANEAVPDTEHIPDWITARGFNMALPYNTWGMWYLSPSRMNWGD